MKSCSIVVTRKLSVLNSIFKYYCIVYKSFYAGMLWFEIIKSYFKLAMVLKY